MANERVTETIVRKHFNKYLSDIIIEEQQSENAVIDSCLKNASKSGRGGQGYPEFIIQFKKDSNFLIVVECKSSVKMHKSLTGREYKDYAVDGALLYSSYLSKKFDVLSIAVSGTEKNYELTHYIQLKNEPKAEEIFSDIFLTPKEYFDGYKKSPQKCKQDYNKLLEYATVLNKKMHSLGINESERSVLLSCILLALRIDKFSVSYKKESVGKTLASDMVDAVINDFKSQSLDDEKIKLIKVEYDKIKVKKELTESNIPEEKQKGVLRSLISEIDENINHFLKTHLYYDTLGELYVEFLKYANADKGLGIVLTPPHITELFCKIARVNKNSIIFDNCTGTCGFLIASMRVMIEDCKGDKKQEKKIKTSQLIGIERDEKMFCLAATNMAIHQDGKTSIKHGSGLDPALLKEVKKKRPSVGFLNPPYKPAKSKDPEELEFVYKNLSCLTDGGKCVAIVPMSCAISTSGGVGFWKEKLLKEHTLDAVFSMPSELFHNSDVIVSTCIMVFTAHQPHPKKKETFFGYFKNDGFEKRKNLGRIDVNDKWKATSNEWLDLYINRKAKQGKSVLFVVTKDDEWCAEAYMETDYSLLSQINFIENIRNLSAYLLSTSDPGKSIEFSTNSVTGNETELNTEKWSWFTMKSIFSLEKGVRLTKPDREPGVTALVTAGFQNTGVAEFIGNTDMQYFRDELTIDMFGYCFYRPYEFCCDDNILVLKIDQNKYVKMFLSSVINLDSYKLSYGRQYRQKTFDKHMIKLPSITVKGKPQPDWKFMESYIKSLPYSINI